MTPAPLAEKVQERFMAAFQKQTARRDVSKISPGFHGTSASIHDSIFSRGLLIPGQDNELRVVNGSAHGNGVYVAKLSNPWLSQGFARGANKMLVCGVVDDAAGMTQTQRLGSFSVTKQSDNVRHVGDAMVVFESARVAPLFVAEWDQACRKVPGAATWNKSNFKTKKGDNVRSRIAAKRADPVSLRNRWFFERRKHKRGSWLKELLKQSRGHFDHRSRWGLWFCLL